jgi:hypothetical protein
MKFYLVTNDIIKTDNEGNPTWTDEPLWLRNEIDTWKERYGYGGRCWATEDARQSLIISPNDDLMDLSQGDLVEILEDEFDTFLEEAFPPQVIKKDDQPDEVIIVSKADILKKFWGYAANHTGTISADETWALVDSPHYITGTVTIAANITLTWSPGITVYSSTYSLTLSAGTTGVTTFYAVGTPSLPIRWGKSTPGMGAVRSMAALPNNCVVNLQYMSIESHGAVVQHNNATNATITLNNLHVRDLSTTFIVCLDGFADTLTINNCYFDRSGTEGTTGPLITMSQANISAGTVTFNDCYIYTASMVRGFSISGDGHTFNFNNCYFDFIALGANAANIPNYTFNFDSCFFYWPFLLQPSATAIRPFTVNNSIFTKFGYSVPVGALNTNTLNNCDFVNASTNIAFAVNNLNISGTDTVAMSGCYTAAFRTADYLYTSTAIQVGGTVAISGERSTPNFPFTPTSVTASSVTSSSVTIGWSAGFRTRNRLRYGTSPGTYDMTLESYGTWADWDGKGQLTKDPVFNISYLKSGTTYYYIAQSYDWSFDKWVSSAEGTFTTTGVGPSQQPSYGYIL